MNLTEAIKQRHSVRSYTDQGIEGDTLTRLESVIRTCNEQSGLNIQLCLNEPQAFAGMMAKYGKFSNVRNYIALVGQKGKDLEEKCGYYGEKIVLAAQQLGLNTCWVAASFRKGKSKNAVRIQPGEKLLMVITVGYGSTNGVSHKVKTSGELSNIDNNSPEWFRRGIEAVQLAPTAKNQQKFKFIREGNKVKAIPGTGFYTKTDLGIAKYHFEIGAGENSWQWS